MKTNAQLRAIANETAARVACALNTPKTPTCHRITRRKGYGHRESFSVPAWAANHPVYFDYYVAHEVCHGHLAQTAYGGWRGHDATFKATEAKALAALGMAPVYENDGKGPYVVALTDAVTGEVLCVKPPNGPQPVCPPLVATIR